MATRSFPKSPEHLPSIDRRCFLASAALATTASITAIANPTGTTLAETLQPSLPPSEVPDRECFRQHR